MLKRVLFASFILLSCQGFCQEWVAQYQTAQTAFSNENYEQALQTGKESLAGYISTDGTLNTNYTSILRLLTTICYSGDYIDQGIEYALKEIQIREKIGEDQNLEYATSLFNLGSLYEVKGEAQFALEAFQSVLDIYKQYYQSTDKNIINCQWKIAANHMSLGNDKAFEIYQSTFEIFGSPEEVTMDYVNACYDYAILLVDKKQYTKAIPYLLDLESFYQSLGSDFYMLLAQVYTNLGLSYHHLSDFSKAETTYANADQLFNSLDPDCKAHLQLKNLRAINYKQMGKSEKAQELLTSLNTSGDAITRATALNNEAVLKQQSGQIQAAKSLILSAIALLSDSSSSNYQMATAETLENLSNLYLLNGQSDSAQFVAQRALSIKEGLSAADSEVASALHRLGEAQHGLGNWSDALTNYEKAIALLNETKKGKKYASILGDMAVLFQDRGDYAKAENLFLEQIRILENDSGKQSIAYATALNNLATLRQIQAEYFDAKSLLQESLEITQSILGESSLNYAGIAENLALVKMQLGEYQEAQQLLTTSLNTRENILGSQHPLYADALQNMGRLKQQKGLYQEAEPLFSQALEIKKKTLGEVHPAYAHAINNMALLYQTMGNFNKSEQLFSSAVGIYKQVYGTNHPEYATALENLATLKKLKGFNNEAAQLLHEALRIDRLTLGENHPRYAITLHNLASIYKDLEQYEEAAKLFGKALKIDKAVFGEEHSAYASTLYNLAVLQQELKKIDSAEINFKRALGIRNKILGPNHPDYAYSQYGLAGLYHLTKEYSKAKHYYNLVIENYLRQIDEFFPSLSEKEKSAFYGKVKPVIESFQDFATEYATSSQDSARAIVGDLYNLQLSTKALLLHASNKVRNRIYNSNNEALINSYQQWTEMKEQLSKYLSYSQEELTEQRINLQALGDEINDIEKFLSQQSEVFADEIDSDSTSWSSIKNTLKEKEAAVEIIRIKKRYIADSIMYVALVIRKDSDSPELVILNEGNHLENRYFNYYRNAIKFTVGDEISYRQFWQPIDAKLKDIEQVYASADGVFNKININTLFDSKENKYVIDEYNVRSVSNTKEILIPPRNAEVNNVAAVFGFPDFNLGLDDFVSTSKNTRASAFGFSEQIPELPGTKTEVEELNKILADNAWQTTLYTREEASEHQVKQVKGPKLLHVATHGFFMQDIDYDEETDYGLYFNDQNYNPLFRSGLLLAGAAGAIYKDKELDHEDGILTAYEAMNLNLDQTSLVVLSACETGVGEVKNGEGVYGLQRAFLVAGAESVIMSLWQVDDYTTQRLMILFYKNWLSGQNKFDAFKTASKTLKKEFEDPFHWGAFIILGVE